MKKILLVIFGLCLCASVRARCVMRGECIEISGLSKPCPFDGEPFSPYEGLPEDEAEEIMELLESGCPNFLLDDNGNRIPNDQVMLCCNDFQVRKMLEGFMLANGVLGRCPTCVRNFKRQICEMSCSPDQANFLEIYTETAADGTEYVAEIDYRVHGEFMDDAFASCAGVIVPQTGLPAINLMCGNAPVCTPDAWFGFTGDMSSNPLAPVQINFLRWNTTDDSMSVEAPACEETAEGDIPCGCIDCNANCPQGYDPTPPDICTVLSLNCIGFSIGLVWFVITFIIFVFLAIWEYKRIRNMDTGPQIMKPHKNKFNRFFQVLFAKIGEFSADNSILVIMLTSWFAFFMLNGALKVYLTANPLEVWSAPQSRSRLEFNYYNERFGPFYRASQVFVKINLEPFESNGIQYGPAFRVEAFQELVALEDAIMNIGKDDGTVTLKDVCFAPLRVPGSEPLEEQCVTMSATAYLPNRYNINNQTYLTNIQNCINNYLSFDCMTSWGGGVESIIAFGGYEGDEILSAEYLNLNFPLTNYLLQEDLIPTLEWERKFLEYLQNYEQNLKPDFVDITYGAERSIEDELVRVSQAEAVPIAISYLLMFLYVAVALGRFRRCNTCLLDSKITVAIGSIVVVLTAIVCALGVMGYAGITGTLLAVNVIPFFVLSVGIDNVFLMVNALIEIEDTLKQYDDYNPNFSFNKKRRFIFSKMMAKVGPSMLITSVTQVSCFSIGTLANFPAVVTFAAFASFSLAFLFVFQITTVVALLSIDYKRTAKKRLDVFCCVQKTSVNDNDAINSEAPSVNLIQRFMGPYSTFILNWKVKIVVAIIFMGFISASVMMIPHLEIGLDQEMAMPEDSYVYKYLVAVNEIFKMGPPVFFVLKSGLDFKNVTHQNAICGGQLCSDQSLATQIFLASQHSDITYLATSSNSWIDDFFDWSGLYGSCCKYNVTDGSFCQSTDNVPECVYCTIERDASTSDLRPVGEAFEMYIPFFLLDTPTDICNKGGLASYYSNVNYLLDSEGRATVYDSNFMAYHTPLATSLDYITAVKYAYEISDNITQSIKDITGLDVEVFPYSVFYVYFEQYLTLWADTFASIGYSIIVAFVLNLLATGFNFLTTFAVITTSVMVVINMMGVMYLWSIPLNAVSCVNLIVSIGIGVEFCSHTAYAYSVSPYSGKERVADALKAVGATIITGITFTNVPIIALAFSYTMLIEVFFFRMFFSLVILGFLHGMIFFPVFLSYLSDTFSK